MVREACPSCTLSPLLSGSLGKPRELDRIEFALPITRTGGLVPGSLEQDTTAITYVFFHPDVSFNDRNALANGYANGTPLIPENASFGLRRADRPPLPPGAVTRTVAPTTSRRGAAPTAPRETAGTGGQKRYETVTAMKPFRGTAWIEAGWEPTERKRGIHP